MESIDDLHGRLGIQLSLAYESDSIYLRATITLDGVEVDSDSIALPVGGQ